MLRTADERVLGPGKVLVAAWIISVVQRILTMCPSELSTNCQGGRLLGLPMIPTPGAMTECQVAFLEVLAVLGNRRARWSCISKNFEKPFPYVLRCSTLDMHISKILSSGL
jgi:hypothetical protein